MKTTISICKLIFEDTDALPNDVFGTYLFDDDREDIPNDEKEPITPEEAEFKNGLYDWFIYQQSDKLTADFLEVYNLAQKGKYSKFLTPENKPVYRGIAFSKMDLRRFLETTGLSTKDLKLGLNDEKVWVFENGTLDTSYTPLLSWTVKKEVVRNFLGTEYDEYLVVFKTMPIKKNGKFLLNPKNLISYTDMPKVYEREEEVVSYGPIHYDKMVIFINPFDEGKPFSAKQKKKEIAVALSDIFVNL